MTTTEILMNCLAGLGLLFVGIKMVTRNLGAVAGDQLRQGIERAGARTSLAVIFGAVAGFVAQSGRTTSFIIASFVHAGMIDARRALPVVLWSNFGCTLVIFAAIFPLHLFALFLLAVAGACIAFERPKPLLNAASATFGLALMLFGLKMTSTSATLLTNLAGFSVLHSLIGQSLLLAFLTGFVATLIAQSHMSIMLIAVALAAGGVFDFDQTLMLICGTHAGSSVITYLTGIHFRGLPRQLVIAQVLYNLVGILVALVIFFGPYLLPGRPDLGRWLSHLMGLSAGNQAALAAIIFNTATPFVLTLFLAPYALLCARLSPQVGDEDLVRPEFLRSEVSENPVATLMLAEQEQLRLLRRLPAYCDWLREERGPKDSATVERFHHAFVQVGNFIDRSQGALMSREMKSDDTEWLLNQQKRQQTLNGLNDTCYELYLVARDTGDSIQSLRTSVIEALDTLLLTAIDAMAKQDADELDVIEQMTSNNGASMERIRRRHLAVSASLSDAERGRILQLTSIFERAAWSVRSFAELLRRAPGMSARPSSSAAHVDQAIGAPIQAAPAE
jgi:phosphate:Na+ symporter